MYTALGVDDRVRVAGRPHADQLARELACIAPVVRPRDARRIEKLTALHDRIISNMPTGLLTVDRAMRVIPIEEHAHVQRAVVLLRLAMALNQDRASDLQKVVVRVYPKRVLLELVPGRTGAELELWSLRKEADYFREIFRRDFFATLI